MFQTRGSGLDAATTSAPQNVDMAVDIGVDEVLRQLKRLREGSGVTLDRLSAAGAVMSALGTSDPTEALARLTHALTELPDERTASALMVDLGIGLPDRFGRVPHGREISFLGERRSAYGAVVQRDVKTLARWSDRAVADLRGRLLADTFSGDLYVVGVVDGDRTAGISLIQRESEPVGEGIRKSTSLDIENQGDGPSLPCIAYSYPRDWRPATLTIAASFRTGVPAEVWAFAAENFFQLSFGVTRHDLARDGTGTVTCRFVNPRRDRIYGIAWAR